MELLRAATLVTLDPEATAARYGQWLDYKVVERGVLPADLAQSFDAPASAGRAYVVCQPASGAEVYLRFVQGHAHPDYQPLRTYGWAAIEICVQDTLVVNARMERSPFEIIGPPRELDGLPAIFPMQVKGPDGEIVYLTQIRENLPAYDLPRAASLVDKLFILVMACSDIAASMAWFDKTLGITAGREMKIVYTMLAKAFGTPMDQKITIATGIHGRDCFLEFDQYPAAATVRPSHRGELKPGIALATLRHPNFDAIVGDWMTLPVRREGPIYGGGRVGVLSAPDGTLVEVVEIV